MQQLVLKQSYMTLVTLAFIGLLVAFYFYARRLRSLPESETVGSFDELIKSHFFRFLGIPVEVWAVLFYALVIFSYGIALLIGQLPVAIEWNFILLIIAIGAVLFSLYLLFIFSFRHFGLCFWAAGLNILILGLITFTLPIDNITTFIQETESAMVVALGFSIAVGTGSAALTAILFFKFLNDLRISREEYEVLSVISQVTWLALGVVIIVSGIMYFYAFSEPILTDSILLTLLALAGVAALTEGYLSLWIGPTLISSAIDDRSEPETEPTVEDWARKTGFALGAVAVVSWFAMMFIVILRDSALELETLLAVYGLAVLLMVILSQLIDRSLTQPYE